MADRSMPLHAAPDEALAGALRDLGASLAYPTSAAAGGPEDLARRARRRIVEGAIRPTARPGLGAWLADGRRPLRRSLVLALVALLVLAAVAAAIGFGLPRLRITFGEAPTPGPGSGAPVASGVAVASGPPGASSPPGAILGLGTAVSFAEAERLSGLDLLLPPDPPMGPPDAVFHGPGGRISLVWRTRTGLPETASAGIGLVIDQFRGTVDKGYFEKIVHSAAQVTPVTVAGGPGYWIDGPPHFFRYVGPTGAEIEDDHRDVGDTLVWTAGGVTFRLESALGRDAAIRLAESLE